MLRRLYFVFPSKLEAQPAVDELQSRQGISTRKMHAMARPGEDLEGLPRATARQSGDLRAHIAWWLWETDLGIFFTALLALCVALYAGAMVWAIVSLAVMIISFVSGALYSMYVPEVSLTEFRDALAHGEVVLMVDVPERKVADIEHCISHHHPSAVAGGSSWTTSLFGI